MENKYGKYLKYAIGEIVLVVIGILIALQVNSWNEQRKIRISERDLINRIISDLQLDEKRIGNYIDYYNDDQLMHHQLFKETQGLSEADSLIDVSTIRGARLFGLIIESNYSKYTKDISNNKVREKIDTYFKSENSVKDAIGYLWDFKVSQLRPFLSKYGINNTKELFDNRQFSYYELREKNIFSYNKLKEQYGTVEFDQILFDLGIKTSWALTALENLLDANKKLQLVFESELSQFHN